MARQNRRYKTTFPIGLIIVGVVIIGIFAISFLPWALLGTFVWWALK